MYSALCCQIVTFAMHSWLRPFHGYFWNNRTRKQLAKGKSEYNPKYSIARKIEQINAEIPSHFAEIPSHFVEVYSRRGAFYIDDCNLKSQKRKGVFQMQNNNQNKDYFTKDNSLMCVFIAPIADGLEGLERANLNAIFRVIELSGGIIVNRDYVKISDRMIR